MALSSRELIELYEEWLDKYPIISIEDGLAEDDWAGLARAHKASWQARPIVGDDIFVTNPMLVREGIRHGIANAVLIKPNQIGTLTETLRTVETSAPRGLCHDHISPIGRDRRHVHCGSCRGHRGGTDQSGLGQPRGAHR
jgi:enolase